MGKKSVKSIKIMFVFGYYLLQIGGKDSYLGCFADLTNGYRDLSGLALTVIGNEVVSCISQCRSKGFPYAGLQMGRSCHCGMTFGLQGNSLFCNTTCEGKYCGGYNSNDIYYTIDNKMTFARSLIFHGNVSNFDKARQECILENGDLVSMDSPEKIKDIVEAVENAAKGAFTYVHSVWLGLRKRLSGQNFEWTDAYVDSFDDHSYDYRNHWSIDDKGLNDCVVLNIKTELFSSTPCDQSYAFVCFQTLFSGDKDNGADFQDEISRNSIVPSEVENSAQMMYIVLPLFFVCYGGSCIAFSVYKIYLNCFTNISESCKPSNIHKNRREKQIFHTLQSDVTLNNGISKANVTLSGSPSKVTFDQQCLISPLEIPKDQISIPIIKIRHNICHSKSISEILRKKMSREIDKKKFQLLINH